MKNVVIVLADGVTLTVSGQTFTGPGRWVSEENSTP